MINELVIVGFIVPSIHYRSFHLNGEKNLIFSTNQFAGNSNSISSKLVIYPNTFKNSFILYALHNYI